MKVNATAVALLIGITLGILAGWAVRHYDKPIETQVINQSSKRDK